MQLILNTVHLTLIRRFDGIFHSNKLNSFQNWLLFSTVYGRFLPHHLPLNVRSDVLKLADILSSILTYTFCYVYLYEYECIFCAYLSMTFDRTWIQFCASLQTCHFHGILWSFNQLELSDLVAIMVLM